MCSRFVWPRIKLNIVNFTTSCINFQKSKIARHLHSPLAKFKVPNQRVVHINIDIIVLLPSSQGFSYCLRAIDRFSRWPAAMPMADIEQKQLFKPYIKVRYLDLEFLSGSQQTEFHSLRVMCFILWRTPSEYVSHIQLPTYPPENGAVQRWHRSLKAAIICHTCVHWMSAFPAALLGLRNVFKENLQFSPAEVVYGETLAYPVTFSSNRNHRWLTMVS
ncbi:hypothetical protein AVEN_241564-1 [Araneus ventricosus]|uniref:Integrase catalytic domain-containing protein n=1 Tax=Araneus ventricosus TaxID=182803 RepID=A0A4Y2TR58_ARAVE|nr:hypothetical protein AVEN_241564-1 [Araneus ventricosus]